MRRWAILTLLISSIACLFLLIVPSLLGARPFKRVLGKVDLSFPRVTMEFKFTAPHSAPTVWNIILVIHDEGYKKRGNRLVTHNWPLRVSYEIKDSHGKVVYSETISGLEMPDTSWANPDTAVVLQKKQKTLPLVAEEEYVLILDTDVPWNPPGDAELWLMWVD